jgi:hypothetical protein
MMLSPPPSWSSVLDGEGVCHALPSLTSQWRASDDIDY